MTGEYFNSINGVRQGGVVSLLMFTVYIDELICRLQKSGIGCFIGQKILWVSKLSRRFCFTMSRCERFTENGGSMF